MENYNTIEEIKARLDEVETKIWMIEMADFIVGNEKRQYEALKKERYALEAMLKARP